MTRKRIPQEKDPELEDHELLRRISEKDVSAFRQFFERYRKRIYNICYRLLADHSHAEDATQDVFLQIYKSAALFRGESQVSTWLYRIAVHRSLNIIRQNKRFGWMKNISSLWREDSQVKLPTVSRRDEPDIRLEEKELAALLRDAIDSLPEKQRVTFILHKYENLTSREIADILKISINSVESRIHRAKVNLQKKLISRLKKIP